MPYEAKVIADSIASGVRLTTLAIQMPTLYWPEVLTHRKFSRNASSARALPAGARIRQVEKDPFIPTTFYGETRGMVPRVPLADQELARQHWLQASLSAVDGAEEWLIGGYHHEHINRLLTPWLWTTAIISSTEWENFFALRLDPDAAEVIQTVAGLMRDVMAAITPMELQPGQWHLPFVTADEAASLSLADQRLVSAARCARVSYLNHEGKVNVERDLALAERLRHERHWSVFEHQATPAGVSRYAWPAGEPKKIEHEWPVSNFDSPWFQCRKMLGG